MSSHAAFDAAVALPCLFFCPCTRALQKRAPTHGAVPSAGDLKKNKEHLGQVKEKREDVRFANLQFLFQREALDRLAKLELENPKKVCKTYSQRVRASKS